MPDETLGLKAKRKKAEAEALTKAMAEGTSIPGEVKKRVDRAERAASSFEAKWAECLCFFDGDQHVEVSAVTGQLDRMETREGGSKPRHRPRLTRNRYTAAIVAESALLSSRTPVYECQAANGDPGPINAARLAEKALLATHEKLSLKSTALDVLLHAANTGSGYTWPHWDPGCGKVVATDDEGNSIREGEIKVWVLGQREVMWDPGARFDDSRWYVVRKALPKDVVLNKPGYIGPTDLPIDATSALYDRDSNKEQVFVYHYLERPSDQHPAGRWLQFAANKLIAKEEHYPLVNKDGNPVDQPCIHQCSWIRRPHRHRDLGVGEMLVDIQRTYTRTANQIIAWKNLVLAPKMMAPIGSLTGEVTDEPGQVIEYRPVGGLKPEWQPVPEIPTGLFAVLDRCIADMQEIIGSNELPSRVESASAISAINEREQNRRALVIEELARWYARQGRHLLLLMQRHYTEKRLLTIQGRFGVEQISDFMGTDIAEVTQVRVGPGSIEPRTRAAQEAKIMQFAQLGWIDPHQAMAALNGGTAERLIDDYELDVAKQHREIQQVLGLRDSQFAEKLLAYREQLEQEAASPAIDPMTGEPIASQRPVLLPVPGEFDNHKVHMDVCRQYMKTKDFEDLPPLMQDALLEHYRLHEQAEQMAQQQQAMMQTAMAESQGMQNAGMDQGAAKTMPSPPSVAQTAQALAGGFA